MNSDGRAIAERSTPRGPKNSASSRAGPGRRKPQTSLASLPAFMLASWLVCSVLGEAQNNPPVLDDDQPCSSPECRVAIRARAGSAEVTAGENGNRKTAVRPAQDPNQYPNEDLPRHRQPLPALGEEEIPELPPTEFQEFVASSLGRKLPIYGANLFEHVPSTFAPVDRVPATDDYRIGPGDEILLRVWGQIDMNGKLLVDRDGAVFLPRVGTLAVAGLKYQQLPEYFHSAIGRVFRNFDLTVSLGQLRSIQVFVVGQARRPGSYTVSSLSTLVNALFASGGPSSTGSLRHIQLKRDGAVVTTFDFYDLLLRGDKSRDARLLPGDVIYIPPAGASMALAGSVNVPAIYELLGETTLAGAIEMAGGVAATADGQKAVVERIENHSTRRVEEFALDQPGLERPVKDGDVVRILALSPRFDNAVTLRGNVARPGRIEWHRGMRLRDLIPSQSALVTGDYWRAANAAVKAGPALPGKAAPGGAAAELRNEIVRGAAEINWDYAVIQRLNLEDLTARLIPFNLGKLVLQGDEENNLALEPGDIITIFSENDLAVPLEKQNKFVRLEGEFRIAGVYRAEPGETVRHLVERAGGLTANAFLFGAEFTRESVRIGQQRGLDRMIEELEQDIARNALAPAGVTPEQTTESRAKLEAQRQLVGKLREIKATGRVVLDLRPDSAQVGDLPALALEDGDRLVVPFRPSTVEMLGAVYSKNSFLYRPGGRVDDYLKRAGGPTRDADTGRMFVIRADGAVLSRQSVKGLWNGGFAALRLLPGDAIVVPERLSRTSILRGLRDWSQVFSQFALGAAAVRVIQ
jgi:polysaccharide export outer membrane protein